MTAGGGEAGETPPNQGWQGGEQELPPAYGGYPPPTPPAPAPGAFGPGPYGPPGAGFPPAFPPAYATPAPDAFPPGPYPAPPGFTPGYPPGVLPHADYGIPYPGDYGYPTARQGHTNTLAVVSLVTSLAGFIPWCWFLVPILGIVFGAVALNQIKRTHEDGHGLAVAGVAVGIGALVLEMILMIFTLNG